MKKQTLLESLRIEDCLEKENYEEAIIKRYENNLEKEWDYIEIDDYDKQKQR